MQRLLSFEQTPPLSVPLRFFLTAPVFAALAGALLLWFGPEALQSRWSPATLALTHLLTLGFLTMCMLGALLQILPVVAGIEVPGGSVTASGVHTLLAAGTITLVVAFLTASPLLFKLALPLLLGAFGWLLTALTGRVWRANANPMLAAIRLALAALGVTVVLGAILASAFAWSLSLPLAVLTDIHASWGLLGWLALLVAGVAYQVVPMFQVTPVYPQWMTRYYAWSVFALLAAWSAAAATAAGSWWFLLLSAGLAGACAALSLSTFYLLWKRKRPKPDPTTMFWRSALGSLLAAALLWTAGAVLPGLAEAPAYPLALGVLVIAGFGGSVVNGMLYKIVPFLVWYHLQHNAELGCAKAPNVKQILRDTDAQRQFWLHLAALLLLLAATMLPQWLARIAAVAYMLSAAMLWHNLLKAARVFREKSAAGAAAAATAPRKT